MPKYHINKAGAPARCGATTRACPLGGDHYDSMEEASIASFEADFHQETEAYAEHWDQNIGEVEAVFSGPQAVEDEDDEDDEDEADPLSERLGVPFDGTYDNSWLDRDDAEEWSDNLAWLADEVEDEDAADAREYMDLVIREADADGRGHLVPSKYRGLPSDADLGINELMDEWEDERFDLDFDSVFDRDVKPVTDAELAEFQSHEDEATAVVKAAQAKAAAEAGNPDPALSEKAAGELQSYEGMKTLDLLAADLADQAHEDFAAGRITQEELEEAVHVAGALRFLLNPAEGRRHTKREARPIDPELIQALRCLYIKRFGVDPFEQGISVPQLLQMRQQRMI